MSCSERFNTREFSEQGMPRVIKNDGRQCAFSEDKVRSGLLKALEKRPVDIATVDLAIAGILSHIRKLGEREITSQRIGEIAMDHLRDIDHVAYVRFASVYRSFKDLSEFDNAIQVLKELNLCKGSVDEFS